MELVEFLKTVVTSKEGWFCLAHAETKSNEEETYKTWSESFYSWPDELPVIINTIRKLGPERNIYFSPYLFSEKSSQKKYALATRTIVADLDYANVLTLALRPSVLVETSTDKHQGYWILKDELGIDDHEALSKRLTYSIPRCDRNGWARNKKVRVPETMNLKYRTGAQYVRVVEESLHEYSSQEIEALPSVQELYGSFASKVEDEDISWLDTTTKIDVGPQELLASIRNSLPSRIVAQYNVPAPDRSVALWGLMTAAFRAGLDKPHVFHLAFHSVNNKFQDLMYGAKQALAKDVLRAEESVNIRLPDVRSKIVEARRLPGLQSERSAYIAKVVREYLEKLGQFVHTNDDAAWYIRNDTGKPIMLSVRSDALSAMLEMLFGINGAEKESSYTSRHLVSNTTEAQVNGQVATLSYYDHDTKTFLLHTGRKDVLHVTKEGITKVNNGYNGIVFPWNVSNSGISPKYASLERSWDEELFEGCLDNIIGLDSKHAQAVLKVWLISLLMREGLVARPILALFGQPGCLSDQTPLQIRRGDHSARTFTINQAYFSFNGRWKRNIPTRIMSLKDGIIQWRTIKDIIFSGKKATYNVSIEGQKTFRTTKDHRFLVRVNGNDVYKKLEDIEIGESIVVRGGNLLSGGHEYITRNEVQAKYHPSVKAKTRPRIKHYRAVIEADMNNISIAEYRYITNHEEEKASKLVYLSDDAHIHHKDENPDNDELSNLQVMTKLEHDTYHGLDKVRNLGHYSGIWVTETSRLISIDYYGTEQTFDIEMEDEEAPNFLVNDVVVHNSGKSTLFRRIYALLYGKDRSLNAVSNENDFDYATAIDALVVLDNVDTWARWLPDRLALAASTSEIVKRKLFTDKDTVILRRQAMLAITAHNPKFGREDVTDRLLLFTFERLQHFKPEAEIINKILSIRNALWGDILRDVQKVLNTQRPTSGWPQFRIEDFASFGYWIATALGVEDDFYKGLETIRKEQKVFSLEEDSILLESIHRHVNKQQALKKTAEYKAPGQWWTILEAEAGDQQQAFNRLYKNAVSLGKKLWTLHDALKEIFHIEYKHDSRRGSRVWLIEPLHENRNGHILNGKELSSV